MATENESIVDGFFGAEKKSSGGENSQIVDKFFGLSPEQNLSARTLGADFDLENFATPGLRLRLARGDTLEEKNLRIKKVFPGGEVKIVRRSLFDPEDKTSDEALVFRESPSEQFKLVEPPGFDLTDVGELIAPSAESIAAETVVALATGGGSIPATVGRQALGALAGETIEQAGQTLTGTQAQSGAGIAGEIGLEGGLSAFGGFAMSPLVAITNVGRGSGVLQVGEEGLETLKAADRLGIQDRVTPGLVADNPIIELQERQASAILPGIRRRYREIVGGLNEAVAKEADPVAIEKASDSVISSLDLYGKRKIAELQVKRTPASRGGLALQEGIAEYDSVAYNVASDLYDAARGIADPDFDITPIRNIANDLRLGSKGEIDQGVEKLIRQFEAIKGPIELSEGKMLSVTDQLRNVQTGAFGLKSVKPGEVAGQVEGQAGDLFRAIKNTLENPINTDPQFVRAWRAANNAARERFETLEKLAVVRVAKSENPADLVKQFAKPGQVGNLVTLRQTLRRAPEKWNDFTNAFRTDLISDPTKITSKLDSFDDETLNALIPRAEQVAWRRAAKEIDRVNAIGADEILEKQVTNKNFLNDFIPNASRRDVDTLLTAAAGRRSQGVTDSLRAGIFDWAWDGIATPGKEGFNVKTDLLKSRIKTLKDNGLWSALSPPQKQLIGDAHKMTKALQFLSDAGTSIRAAEIGAGLSRFKAGAWISLFQSGVISHFYLSAPGRKILFGTGLPNSRGPIMRAIGGAMAQVSSVEDISSLKDDEE